MLAEDGRGVDVALDEVAAQAVADPERPLEVDAVARLPVAQVRAGEVSGPAWTSKLPYRQRSTTVRQQPLTATLSPSFEGSAAGRSGPDDRESTAVALLARPARPAPALRPIP